MSFLSNIGGFHQHKPTGAGLVWSGTQPSCDKRGIKKTQFKTLARNSVNHPRTGHGNKAEGLDRVFQFC